MVHGLEYRSARGTEKVKVRVLKVRILKVRVLKVRVLKVWVFKVRVLEVRVPEVRVLRCGMKMRRYYGSVGAYRVGIWGSIKHIRTPQNLVRRRTGHSRYRGGGNFPAGRS